MRFSTLAATACLCGAAWIAIAADARFDIRTDVQLRAMLDELARSKTLHLNDLDKPYFISYTSSDADQVYITASLGGLTSSSRIHYRQPRIEVRVGDYKFDNTNSIFTGSARSGLFPIDDDYQAMRTHLWLSTDALYKASAEQITQKRTALREMADPENIPDLTPAKPVQVIQPVSTLKVDQKHWEEIVRQLSARFEAHSGITVSNVRMRSIVSTYRLVNSEGAMIRIPQDLTDIDIRSSGLAPDGSRVWNHQFVTVLVPSELPSPQQLTKIADAIANETDALAKAPLAEEYSGPVLFEREAAAEMMAQVLTDALRLERKPLAPPGAENRSPSSHGAENRDLEMLDNVWASRIGSKVGPDWLTVFDDPLQEQWNGTVLAGHYDADDQGVPAERVSLVDKGTLKSFLFSREPVRTFNASNGHGRLPGGFGGEEAVIGNLFIQAQGSVSEAQLKAKLLQAVSAAGLKYGMIVRRIDFPSTADFEELQNLARQLQKNGYARTLNPPVLAYRVYPDGHEELVRGVRFKEFSAKDLRDLSAASDRPYVLNYVNNGSAFNYADSGSEATTSSVICPSLLFESIDLDRARDELSKPPLVPPPTLIAQQ
ncbi:MAG: metallopeptidase TldD-related protein [Bryobacteraceae bacterium]